jgi:hypothetical protein
MSARRPPPEVRGTLARISGLVFCTGLLVASPGCSRQPRYFGPGQPIPIASYTLTVSSVEMSYKGSQSQLVVFLRWAGVNASLKSDRDNFVAMCQSRRFTLVDDKGHQYGYSDPMPEEAHRAQEIAERIAEATRNGMTPSPSDYDSMQKWHDAAQRKWADGAPENWTVVFRISPESRNFTLLISRSSYPFATPFGDPPAAVSLGQ